MTTPIGRDRWAIAEGYIPSERRGPEPCLLNAADEEAQVRITILFSDRESVAPYRLMLRAWRTLQSHAWATGAPLLLLRVLLGLEPRGDVLAADPVLPEGISRLVLRDIPGRWGKAAVA